MNNQLLLSQWASSVGSHYITGGWHRAYLDWIYQQNEIRERQERFARVMKCVGITANEMENFSSAFLRIGEEATKSAVSIAELQERLDSFKIKKPKGKWYDRFIK